MIVFIDRQHAGQIHRIEARGASRDIDGDGQISAFEMEAIWTARIAIELEIQLLDMGCHVLPISDGKYSERHARVNDYATKHPGPWVYLAMHLNAGGGNYGSYFYDHRSSQGPELAKIMARHLEERVPELNSARGISSNPDDWTKNAYYTIKNVGRPVAICCEPFFMDTHQQLLSIPNILKVATSMALALQEWSKT